MGTTQMLEELTLEAVKARSIAHHLQRGEQRTHFNPNVSWMQRLAVLGDTLGLVFKTATVDRVPGTDSDELQAALISLAADALTWAEVLDKHSRCTCVNVTPIDWSKIELIRGATPCPVHSKKDEVTQ